MASRLTVATATFWRCAKGPLLYGVNDCASTVADVIKAAGGPDMMASLRGRYDSETSFRRILVGKGYRSVGEYAESLLSEAGTEVTTPRDLDVGVCHYTDNMLSREAPAVRLGGFWMVRTDRGGAGFIDGVARFWRVIHA